MREAVKRYAEKAGVQEWEKVSPHTFRHTFATDLLEETSNIRLVQKALGHENLLTTQLYTHLTDTDLKDALQEFRHRARVEAQ
jgi:site-specific recombinase XerD